MNQGERLFNSGVLPPEMYGKHQPPKDLWEKKKNGLVIVECPQRIPCNPCHTGCPTGAIKEFADINDTPQIDYEKCTGCAMCVAKCPDLPVSSQILLTVAMKRPYLSCPMRCCRCLTKGKRSNA